jgi:magnesium transporter
MKKKRQNKKLFHSPITLNIAREDGVIHFDLMAYDENSFSRRESTDWQEVEKFARLNEGKTLWINAYHLENKVALEQLEEFFGINPFLMADAVDFSLRSKMWFTEKHLFCSFKMIKPNNDVTEHVSFIIGDNFLISLQELREDVFDHIRNRITNNFGLIRKKGNDYLFFLLCDAIIDQYTLVSDENENALLEIEEEIHEMRTIPTLNQIHNLKRNTLSTHKDIRAAYDVLEAILKSDFYVYTDFVKRLFTSIIHNAGYSLDSFSRQLENVKNLSDLYFSQQNNKLNEMIKWLTIMSSLFIPLSFIAGFYGMNFMYMPELKKEWAYPGIVILMLTVVGYILFLFKRKKWL